MKYRRDKVLNVVDQRTGRKLTAKELEQYQTAEDKKEKDIIQVRGTPSNSATLETSESVLIRGVASFHGWICTIKVSWLEGWPHFRGPD